MGALSLIGFANPLLLWGLALLPVIWWLLRYTPPKPLRQMFPPIRLLLGLHTDEETPSKSPWWLTALRVILAGLIILALSGPSLRPEAPRAGIAGPLVLVIDNGWAAAPDWDVRVAAARDEIALAIQAGQPVLLAAGASAGPAQGLALQEGARALERLNSLEPEPFAPDRMAALAHITQGLGGRSPGRTVWLSDGIDHGRAGDFAAALAALAGDGGLDVYRADLAGGPLVLAQPSQAATGLEVPVRRAASGRAVQGLVRALALNGRPLGEAAFTLGADAVEAKAGIDMPLELRNEVARLEISGGQSAGAVQLLDDRWRRRRAGLISGESQELSQPLLSPLYYVERALAPYAELHNAPGANLEQVVPRLIEARVGMIVMTDVGTLAGGARDELAGWVEKGGVLVRFAGPRLADGTDDLVPVKLRQGGRTLGGALSWSTPQPLGAFDPSSPFHGADLPREVTVSQQVLAEPDIDLAQKTWAQLADGTPLVTAAPRGKGWIILFHVSANTSWSNLPLSGLFVEMLRRITDMASSSGIGQEEDGATAPVSTRAVGDYNLAPIRNLDGRGLFIAPPATARPAASSIIDTLKAGPEHPPGFYGTQESFRAINAFGPRDTLTPIAALPEGARVLDYVRAEPVPLKPWLFLAALLLLIADTIAVLALTGFAGLRPRRARMQTGLPALAVMAAMAVASMALPGSAQAQQAAPDTASDAFAMRATLETRLAYVHTGQASIDEATQAGLWGLTRILTERTALEPGEPMSVDIARDELAFFPFIYWAIDPAAPMPDAATLAKVDAYMKQGGTILFDTRDQAASATSTSLGGGGPGMQALRRLLASFDVPRLEPVPADHVLTKAFYLLQGFPGRYEGGPLWVETSTPNDPRQNRPARNSDGVSSIMITSNDLAAAWAMDENRAPLYPVVPGGERQREMALRTGVNIVMYTLTGNYKADQVHVPALLERLGQ